MTIIEQLQENILFLENSIAGWKPIEVMTTTHGARIYVFVWIG